MKKPHNEGTRKLGSPVQKQTREEAKRFPFEQKMTKAKAAKGSLKSDPIKDKPTVKDVGRGVGAEGKTGKLAQRTAKKPEPDNIAPKRASAKITPTTPAGKIKQSGSKAAKRLEDVRI
jgi:hypothetical protein